MERWFRELTEKAIRRGVFRSVSDLERAIAEKLDRARTKWKAIQPDCTRPRRRESRRNSNG